MMIPWTIPSMAPPPVPKLGAGVVFQSVPSRDLIPVLSFSMAAAAYYRRRFNSVKFR
jgi:hypothetical protein